VTRMSRTRLSTWVIKVSGLGLFTLKLLATL
jgi:hypothetical protein